MFTFSPYIFTFPLQFPFSIKSNTLSKFNEIEQELQNPDHHTPQTQKTESPVVDIQITQPYKVFQYCKKLEKLEAVRQDYLFKFLEIWQSDKLLDFGLSTAQDRLSKARTNFKLFDADSDKKVKNNLEKMKKIFRAKETKLLKEIEIFDGAERREIQEELLVVRNCISDHFCLINRANSDNLPNSRFDRDNGERDR
jgi:hypothetical protein